jgi:hypothetical protein
LARRREKDSLMPRRKCLGRPRNHDSHVRSSCSARQSKAAPRPGKTGTRSAQETIAGLNSVGEMFIADQLEPDRRTLAARRYRRSTIMPPAGQACMWGTMCYDGGRKKTRIPSEDSFGWH